MKVYFYSILIAKTNFMQVVRYNNVVIRYVAAFIAATYSVLHGRFHQLSLALVSPGFYFAFTVSLLVALLVISAVHHITIVLDTFYGWRKEFWARALLQICLGIFAPAFVDFVVIAVYFLTRGQNIFYNGYITGELPIVLIMLFLLNCYYCLHYMLLTSKSKKPKQIESDPLPEGSLQGLYRGHSYYYKVAKDVLYFYYDRKNVRFVTKEGKEFPLNATISNLAAMYAKDGFCQVSRGLLINCRIIQGYSSGIRGNTLVISIMQEYKNVVPNFGQDHFLVTKKYIDSFKKQYTQYMAASK